MGPNDPFKTIERPPVRPDGTHRPVLDTLSGAAMPRENTMKRLAPLVGLALEPGPAARPHDEVDRDD